MFESINIKSRPVIAGGFFLVYVFVDSKVSDTIEPVSILTVLLKYMPNRHAVALVKCW